MLGGMLGWPSLGNFALRAYARQVARHDMLVYCSDNRLLRIFLIVDDFFIFASLWEVLSCILFLAGLARQTLMFLIIARC